MNGTCSNREICEQRRVCWCKERTRAFGEQMRRPASKCCRRCWSHHRPAHKITGTMRRWGQEKSEENNPCLIASLVFAHIVAIRELGRILREFFVRTALGHDKCDFDGDRRKTQAKDRFSCASREWDPRLPCVPPAGRAVPAASLPVRCRLWP